MTPIPGTAFLRACAQLVPSSHREEWLDEWIAEATHAWLDNDAQTGRDAWMLRLRCAGAISDALWMRRRFHQRSRSSAMNTQNVRFALRMLRRRPGYAAVVVGTLALCIGATSSIFSVVNAVLLDSLNYERIDRLVSIWSNDTGNARERNEVSIGDYRDYRERTRTLSSVAAFFPTWNTTFTATDAAERLDAGVVSANFFSTVGVSPLLGRLFAEGEDDPGAPRVVVLSHSFWTRQFGRDSAILGTSITLDGEPYQVIGVLRDDFVFPESKVDVVAPLPMLGSFLTRREVHIVRLIGRMHESASIEGVREELTAIARQLEVEHPEHNAGFGVTVLPTRTALLGDVQQPLRLLFASVIVVLMIGCVNVANLMLTHAASRRHELAVRTAIGASTSQLRTQLLTESVVVAVLAGAIGTVLAWAITPVLGSLLPGDMQRLGTAQVDSDVLVFSVTVTVLTALVCGLLPAMRGARANVSQALRDSTRGSSPARQRTQRALVVSELALSLVLTASAGLLVNSFARLSSVNTGFTREGVVRMKVSLAGATYASPALRSQTFDRLIAAARAMPGVISAGATSRFPLHDGNVTTSVLAEGRPATPGGALPDADMRVVTPGYMESMGIELRDGRELATERTDSGAVPVALLNSTAARLFFDGTSPVGKRIQLGGGSGPWLQVVGVVGDVRDASLREEPRPQVFLSAHQSPPRTMSIVVRHRADPTSIVNSLRESLRQIDPTLPLYDAQTIGEVLDEASKRERFSTAFLLGFSVLALLLAAIGTYGVIAYGVTSRTRELGVRIALGAQRSEVRAMVLREGAKLFLVALPIGLFAVFASSRVLRSSLYGVGAGDPATLVASVVVLFGVALAACWVPAWRASRIDPLVAIRAE